MSIQQPTRSVAFPLLATGGVSAIVLLGFVVAYRLWDVGWWSVPLVAMPAGVAALAARDMPGAAAGPTRSRRLALLAGGAALALWLLPLAAFEHVPRYELDLAPGEDPGRSTPRVLWWAIGGLVALGALAVVGRRTARQGPEPVARLARVVTGVTLLTWLPFMGLVGLGAGLASPEGSTVSDGVRAYLPVLGHGSVPALAVIAGAAWPRRVDGRDPVRRPRVVNRRSRGDREGR
jgi:hypothetical protein